MQNKGFSPEITPEKEISPEQKSEQAPEASSEHKAQAVSTPVITQTSTKISDDARVQKSPQLLEIEGIMSEDLDQAYMSMSPEKRQQFRQAGEQTARVIQSMIKSGKATVRKIRDLIIKWLKMFPGINKFFLEQEAKIKADRIMGIKKE